MQRPHQKDSFAAGVFQNHRIGSITHYSDPINGPGVDIAVIEMGTSTPIQFGSAFVRTPVTAREVPDRQTAFLYGSASGHRKGWVNGALQLTRDAGGRFWENCWSVMEIDGGFAQRGNSGGLVETCGGEPLGHLVAALGTQRASGRHQCGLVQDAATSLDFLKTDILPGMAVSFLDWDSTLPRSGLLTILADKLFD